MAYHEFIFSFFTIITFSSIGCIEKIKIDRLTRGYMFRIKEMTRKVKITKRTLHRVCEEQNSTCFGFFHFFPSNLVDLFSFSVKNASYKALFMQPWHAMKITCAILVPCTYQSRMFTFAESSCPRHSTE